jgi:glycerol-3-phosphate dehydrogenase (NAD(P)+)
MIVVVLGAGAWGTAVAVHAARRHEVRLWARSAEHAEAMRGARRNERYLPGTELPVALSVTADLDQALAGVTARNGLLVLAAPVAGLAPLLDGLPRSLPAPTVWLCKGLERDSGLLPHEIVRQCRPDAVGAVLSGPSFAQEVAAGLPVALTVATTSDAAGAGTVQAFHHGAARIYRSDDVVGVEVGGALKNVMAIAAGICDGLGLGHNARAALITRGLAETSRYGVAQGARPDTFMGLTGLGDLVLTCTGDLSRNRRVGLALAAGTALDQAVRALGHVAEGVACARAVLRRAESLGVEVPIVAAVNAVLEGAITPRDAVLALLSREPRHERD